MTYNLIITENAEALLDDLVCYILYKLKNRQAAKHLLDEVEKIYERIEQNPYQFSESEDNVLSYRGYREAPLADMRYVVVYYIDDINVYVSGVFHQLELYKDKISN